MGDNTPRLESVEFENWGASRISGKFDVDPRTLLYGVDSDALREILRPIRRGLGIVEEALDGVYPRLESVEFENWGASRIGGKFAVDPRTLLYDVDSDALCEILRALRRGLGIVEEALDGVYPRLESVECENWGASRIGGKFAVDPRTLLYDVDSDALCEILRALRRGLGIVEEALERRRRIRAAIGRDVPFCLLLFSSS